MLQLRIRRLMRVFLGLATLGLLVWGGFRVAHALERDAGVDRFHFFVLFKDVQGLRPGSEMVHRGMAVGEVVNLALDAPAGRVRVEVRLQKNAPSLLRSTAQIWIVRPRFGLISRELSGLDTLIKESYLRLRIGEKGEALEPGGEILGRESPPPKQVEEDLEDPESGDLVAQVVFPQNRGLTPGSPVSFRGMAVGKVRKVRLVDRGQGVLVIFSVRRAFRETVRGGSRFWISRPRVQGNVISGMSVADLDSVLFPGLVYDSPARKETEPATDGEVFVGVVEPPSPERDWQGKGIDINKAANEVRISRAGQKPISPTVRVRYRAVEQDTLGDDPLAATGKGIIFRRAGGDLMVLTGRSACDASFELENHWYDRLRIADEQIRVVLSDGRILPACRLWVHPDEDLALLRLGTSPGTVLLPAWPTYLDFSVAPGKGVGTGVLNNECPLLLQHEGKSWGLLGRKKNSPKSSRTVTFSALPARLRPGSK